MKKIINGKTYSTETAEQIASYYNGQTGLCYFFEALYKTKKGSFFIAGDGGAMTYYSRSCGSNCWTGGEDLRPATESEARKWLEEYADTETYEKCFGTPEEA